MVQIETGLVQMEPGQGGGMQMTSVEVWWRSGRGIKSPASSKDKIRCDKGWAGMQMRQRREGSRDEAARVMVQYRSSPCRVWCLAQVQKMAAQSRGSLTDPRRDKKGDDGPAGMR